MKNLYNEKATEYMVMYKENVAGVDGPVEVFTQRFNPRTEQVKIWEGSTDPHYAGAKEWTEESIGQFGERMFIRWTDEADPDENIAAIAELTMIDGTFVVSFTDEGKNFVDPEIQEKYSFGGGAFGSLEEAYKGWKALEESIVETLQ